MPDDVVPTPRLPGKLGRNHQRNNSPGRERFAIPFVTEVATIPPPTYPVDVSQKRTAWGMLGNDKYGDCVPAAHAHDRMLAGAKVTEQQVVDLYLRYDKGVDEGVVIADFLLWLFQQGAIEGFAPVPLHKVDAVMAWLGRGVILGVELTDRDQDDFTNNVPWGVSSTTPNPELGHGVLKVKSDGSTLAGRGTCVTWGALQGMTGNWQTSCVMEAWAVITSDDVGATGYADLYGKLRQLPKVNIVPLPPQPVPEPQPPAPAPPPPQPSPTPGVDPHAVHHLILAFARAMRHALTELEKGIDSLLP